MEDIKVWRKFYECDCGGEGVMLAESEKEEEYPAMVTLAFFSHGQFGKYPLPFKEKMRWCWHIIRTGTLFADEVIMRRHRARELGADLLEWSDKQDELAKKEDEAIAKRKKEMENESSTT